MTGMEPTWLDRTLAFFRRQFWHTTFEPEGTCRVMDDDGKTVCEASRSNAQILIDLLTALHIVDKENRKLKHERNELLSKLETVLEDVERRMREPDNLKALADAMKEMKQ